MIDDGYKSVLDGFIADLKQAWHAAGTPSYAELEQVSVRLRARRGPVKVDVLARSTTQEILSGQRQRHSR